MGRWFLDRALFFKVLAQQSVFSRVVAGASLPIGVASLWRDELADAVQQEKFRIVNFLPDLPLSWWIVIWLTLALVWVFEAAFRLQRPGMALVFKDDIRSVHSGDGPMLYAIGIGLHNGTSHRLNNCRLQLHIFGHNHLNPPSWVRHTICAPFSLSPDDTHYIDIFKYEFDTPQAYLQVVNFVRKGDLWEQGDGHMVLRPGSYDIVVEALSDDSRIARLKLKVENRNDRWWINGSSTAV